MIEDIIKVFKSLENGRIFLKGTARKIISQEGGLLNFLGWLMKVSLPLMKNVLLSLAKIGLIPLGLTAVASDTDAGNQKKIYKSAMTTLISSNEEMEDIKKIDKSLEEYGLLIKGISKTILKQTNKQKRWI